MNWSPRKERQIHLNAKLTQCVLKAIVSLMLQSNKNGATYDGYIAEKEDLLIREQIDDDAECEPQIRQCEPRENKTKEVVLKQSVKTVSGGKRNDPIPELGYEGRTCEEGRVWIYRKQRNEPTHTEKI